MSVTIWIRRTKLNISPDRLLTKQQVLHKAGNERQLIFSPKFSLRIPNLLQIANSQDMWHQFERYLVFAAGEVDIVEGRWLMIITLKTHCRTTA